MAGKVIYLHNRVNILCEQLLPEQIVLPLLMALPKSLRERVGYRMIKEQQVPTADLESESTEHISKSHLDLTSGVNT
jgi:hypothetical protein